MSGREEVARRMRRYFVYMLACEGGSLYTGITTDIARRLREHLGGRARGARYTRTHRPQELVALWTCEGRDEASRLEYRIKRLSRSEKEALLAHPLRAGELCGGEEGHGVRVLWPRLQE